MISSAQLFLSLFFITMISSFLKSTSPGRKLTTLASSLSTRSSTSSDIKITSYNVLSSKLGGPGYYTSCRPEWLDVGYRFRKLKEKLDVHTSLSSVICLQELSLDWTAELHPYFAEKNYYLITTQYGNKFNGYMGVGIAIPLVKYALEDVNITKISDTKYVNKVYESTAQKVWRKLSDIASLLIPRVVKDRFSSGQRPKGSVWETALQRSNQMLCVRLKEQSGKSFVVGTYHMPCMFDFPAVMVAHCALSAQHIQRFAKSDPHVYCGDFNIKPGSVMYNLLTEGKLDEKHPDYPSTAEGDNWTPNVSALRSAYYVSLGREPDCTNYAKVGNSHAFIDTLDYIFLSREWEVKDVLPLPAREDIAGPLPNEQEPSDHLLVSATLSLHRAKEQR